jgi:hypothetical protein
MVSPTGSRTTIAALLATRCSNGSRAAFGLLYALAIVALVPGCASYPADPSKIGVVVEPPTIACSEEKADIPVEIRLRNDSGGVLEIGVDGKEGPPFEINWIFFDVLDERGETDWRHGPGDHGPVPYNTLRIGPHDGTTVKAFLYEIGASDHARKFRIRLEDEEDHTYTTDAFLPCVMDKAASPTLEST